MFFLGFLMMITNVEISIYMHIYIYIYVLCMLHTLFLLLRPVSTRMLLEAQENSKCINTLKRKAHALNPERS